MAAPLEVILSSDSGSQLWNLTVFDLHSGSSLLSYRGGNSSARTLTLLRGQYILSAQLGKNFINVWEIQRKDQLQQKIVCPGVVTCLNASPDGLFLAAAVAEAIYLWEVSTGKLLSVLSRHYQDVTCLKFTDDSSHFVSGGKDNLALVWNLSSVIQLDLGHTPEPRHVLSRHSLPITDLHCGMMGVQARVVTASLDQTVKVWELSSGELLLSILFDVEIMSVTSDPCEYFLFCGGSDGNIFQVSLCSQGLSRDRPFQSDTEQNQNQIFKGHTNMVGCVSVSMDGTLLLSGSHDETVRVWDIQSKQTIRCLAHKGPVTNAVITAAPANMFLPDSRPAVPLPRFSRHLNTSEGDGRESGEVCVRLGLYTQEEEESYLLKAHRLNALMNAVTDKSVFGDGENTKVRVAELEDEVHTLKKINKDLYEFSSQLLTKPT
ncbi:WD repeat-containing protein 18 isoform X2 [Takifugu rubripes]|uniref:WD repeat-containing protein 18 isoform X2 n=1 Tax=Takifugu rubripes TaxID=31033 RepID=UPI001145D62A|nr:WD repeat-containing protein 18 isoform X2 [Takifugu rubripes]XP_056894802.1 WD repeat-containing protein 18 isoform X2 [Takifugu flavidus]